MNTVWTAEVMTISEQVKIVNKRYFKSCASGLEPGVKTKGSAEQDIKIVFPQELKGLEGL